MTRKRWTARERVDIVAEFVSTSIGAAEICRKYGVPPATFDNWHRRFMDAGRRELAGIGGGDPAKALAKETESLRILAGDLALANAALKKTLEQRKGRARPKGRRMAGQA